MKRLSLLSVIAVAFVAVIVLWSPSESAYNCCPGNVNGTNSIDLADLSSLSSYLTGGGYILPCQVSANVNGQSAVDLADLSALINYLSGGQSTIPACPSDWAVDREGNVYRTITIGTQVWMAENLKVSHFRNGDPIPFSDTMVYTTQPMSMNPDKNAANVPGYGRLYNWGVVTDSRKIAPYGWHIPTDSDFQVLQDYLGGSANAGAKLKEAGTMHWSNPNVEATNSSGFTALPLYPSWVVGYFWSQTINGDSKGALSCFSSNGETGHLFQSPLVAPSDYFAIRCVKGN
jgi:uncharacterized protein (TIGR02145 family)